MSKTFKRFTALLVALLLAAPAYASDPKAVSIKTNTSAFNGALSSSDTDVQKSLDTLDNAVGSISAAPIGATYITQTTNGTLTNEQALGSLATGIVKNTTTTGVLSIAAAGTDYLAPGAIGSTVQAYDADLTTYAGITPSANVQTLLGSADFAAFRTSLSLVIGTNVQAYDADLTTYAGITPSANIQSLLGSADYSAARTNLGLAIGTNVQAYDADLTTWAGLTPSAYFQTLVDDADASAARTTLGLGTLATQSGTFSGTSSGTNTGDQTTISGNAGTATALAANGGNCASGEYPLGVDASGAVESCTDATTEISSAISTHAALTATHGVSGAIVGTTDTQTLTNKTLTSPKIGTNILDTNGVALATLTATASAVNQVTLANAATGTNPTITASGSDSNIGVTIATKGTGAFVVSSSATPTQSTITSGLVVNNASAGNAADAFVVNTDTIADAFKVNAATNAITMAAPISTTSTILTSSRTTDAGWSVVTGANTACNTTCTSACVVGFDVGTLGVALAHIVACTDATADECLCAGSS